MVKKLMFITIFSLAFAFTEAFAAFYLKTIVGLNNFNLLANYHPALNLGFIGYTQAINSAISPQLLLLETRRETATMIMLLGVACLAGEKFKQKLGAYLIAFSLWDIFYYVFLRTVSGWPQSLWDMDVVAITPGIWAAPVINAIVVSLLLLLLGLKLFFSKNNGDELAHPIRPEHQL